MDKTAEKVLDFFQSIDELVFCLFMFFMPFGWGASVVPLILFLFLQVLAVFKEGRIPSRKKLTYFAPVFFYFGWSLLSLTWSANVSNGLQIIGQQISLLLIPLTFLFVKPDMVLVRKGIRFFIVGLLFSGFLLIGNALYKSLSVGSGGLVFTTEVTGAVAKILDSSIYGNHFMGVRFSTLMHPSYYGIMLANAMLYLIWGAIPGSLFTINMKFANACLLFFSWMLILMSTNAVVCITAVVLCMWMIVHVKNIQHYTWRRMFSLFFGLLFLVYLVFSPQAQILWFNGMQEVWQVKWELAKATYQALQNNLFFGLGLGSGQAALDAVLSGNKVDLAGLNPHNQYMHSWLSLGLVGLVFLNWIWLNILYIGVRRHIFLMVAFAVITLISFSFESMLYRYWGVVFFSTFYSLIYFYNDNTEEDTQLIRVRYKRNKLVRVN